MKGKISQWKDDKGFGFITAENGKKVFFHISSVAIRSRRPQVGDSVIFRATTDNQNRLKATEVAIKGLDKAEKRLNNKVEPKTKDALDYLLILLTLIFTILAFLTFSKSHSILQPLILGALGAIPLLLLNRPKKPKNASFQCFKCKKNEAYGQRTIAAWNRGFSRIYCNTCHAQWIRNNPQQEKDFSSNRNGGCLGTFTLIITASLFSGYSIINWFIHTVI